MKNVFFPFVLLLLSLGATARPLATYTNEIHPQAASRCAGEVISLNVDCTIKGTITIIFNDGTRMTLQDATITFVGVSCGQLLKELWSSN